MSLFHSGKNGKVTSNGTDLPIVSWNAAVSVSDAEFLNSQSSGFPTYESGIRKTCTGTVVVEYDFSAPLPGAPTGIYPGAIITNLKLFLNGSTDSTNAFILPSAEVTSLPVNVNVTAGKPGISFGFKNNGTFTIPGGVTP